MINYIVYGNTDYLDILQIQTDYIHRAGKVSLLINSNDMKLDELYSKYDKVIFYDGNQPYATRLLSCLSSIDDEYFILIHDIDILLNVETDKLNELHQFIQSNNFDRLDLKHTDKADGQLIFETNSYQITDIIKDDNIYLISQDNSQDYIYNVNPSIWRKASLIDLLTMFPNKTYRTIEEQDVQNYAKKFRVFKMHSRNNLNCGYFKTLNVFKYLHISHSGKLLPLDSSFTTVYGQSYLDASEDYIKIVNQYNLKNSDKWIK